MASLVERILEHHRTRSFGTREKLLAKQKEVREDYLAIGPGEIELIVRAALDDLDADGKEPLRCLACFRPGSLRPFHHELVARGVFYPPVVYHSADASVADDLKQLLDNDENLNNILLDLVWIGDEAVQEALHEWREKPPQWCANLYVPPHRYAEEAGWELTSDGKRRDLFSVACYPLVRHVDDDARRGMVRIGADHQESCRWCGRRLVVLVELSRECLSLVGVDGGQLRIATCDVCTCYGPVFTKVDWQGGATWHARNARPEYLPEDSSDWDRMPVDPLALGRRPRHFLESADWLLPGVSYSQIGGLPTWIQDAEYPRCPECSRPMFFLGQLSNEDFIEHAEGTYYLFLCTPCGVAATGYQQS